MVEKKVDKLTPERSYYRANWGFEGRLTNWCVKLLLLLYDEPFHLS